MEPPPIIRRNIDILPYFLCQSLKIIQETTISLESHRIKMVSSAFQTNSFSSDGSSMQFSGAGLVRQVIPRERFPNLQPAHGTQRQNDKSMALHSPATPGLLALDLAGDIAAGPHLAMKGGCSTLKLQWSSDLLINPIKIPYPSISHLRFFAIPSAEELPSLALRRRWPSLWVIVAGVPPAGAKSAWRTRRTSCGPHIEGFHCGSPVVTKVVSIQSHGHP